MGRNYTDFISVLEAGGPGNYTFRWRRRLNDKVGLDGYFESNIKSNFVIHEKTCDPLPGLVITEESVDGVRGMFPVVVSETLQELCDNLHSLGFSPTAVEASTSQHSRGSWFKKGSCGFSYDDPIDPEKANPKNMFPFAFAKEK